ncbi:hypothetical protein KC332_g1593 [Hortaea werneckii]|uniref:UPF3 domain-containing protein n=2 Tax=Hortaea werneckii TaxID=91943 RepID=A0A3M7IWC6_HORWE|nr:hypothetical protein KC358_g1456 [Hortaea werneckii]OTA36418.1 hypothetical protein BTJ68_03452 [Hortaea werneckii EXF-2000]KAI6852011.1 hypothetical protein KC350_g1273 [Hortaea werneckii]KAI6943408.1 hypothetical protein KC341_g1513 [Hortaea werneckii]KAI6951024.1 hypothetical protein KC348_g317 [Hortaea werneckii]
MPPKQIAKNDRGVLPVNAAARAAPTAKAPAPRLKLEIRRLPPGLTLTEFEEALGEEWKLGNGKVDWREYRQGKIRAPGKLPEQSRCYIHVVNESVVREFEQRFLNVAFHDKAGTHRHVELKTLQPTIGFATNQRTPLAVKQRLDNRQGTIDQDPEFIAFLESETQPIPKPAAVDAKDDAEHPAVKSTPLIDDLRERKANKAKNAASKAEKKKEEDGKGHASAHSKGSSPQKGAKGAQQDKVEQAGKEAAKALNKQAAGKATAQQQQQQANAKTAPTARSKKQAQTQKQQSASAQSASPGGSAPPSPAPNRNPAPQRQRGNAEGIKKMLQKDLGIKPKQQSGANQSNASKQTPQAVASPPASTTTPTPPTPAQNKNQPPAGPKANAQNKQASQAAPAQANASQLKAYLKHANPSQGMTEMLILRSLSEFGEVANVTIDPRKGTAIAVFKDGGSLKKALEAKKVPVANGAVEVFEFKEAGGRGAGGGGGGEGGGNARGRGGFRGGRGGGRGGAQGTNKDGKNAGGQGAAGSGAQNGNKAA